MWPLFIKTMRKRNKKNQIYFSIATVLVLGCVTYFAVSFVSKYRTHKVFVAMEQQKEKDLEILVEKKAKELAFVELTEKYQNTQFGFRFLYPAGFQIDLFDYLGDTAITVADTDTGLGFQIYLSVYDDLSETFTFDKIRSDAPEIEISEPTEVDLGRGVKGLVFASTDQGKKTRELWFVYKGQLYQITSPLRFDDTLKRIVSTWEFVL